MLQIGRRVGAAALLAISGLSLISTQAQAQLGLGNLIVAMTSPASGSIVSDTVSVSASVSVIGLITVRGVELELDTPDGYKTDGASVSVIGLITVRGVQFQLDGANLGADDTT